MGLSFPGDVSVHFKLIFPQNLVFSCSIRSGQNPINSAPYGNCCDPYFLHLDQLSIVFDAKDGGDLFVCRQATFRNGHPVENTLQKGLWEAPPFPLLIAWKMPRKFKINGDQLKKKRKSEKCLFPEMQSYFFHLYIRAQTVSVSSGFCRGDGVQKSPYTR